MSGEAAGKNGGDGKEDYNARVIAGLKWLEGASAIIRKAKGPDDAETLAEFQSYIDKADAEETVASLSAVCNEVDRVVPFLLTHILRAQIGMAMSSHQQKQGGGSVH